MTNYPTAWQRRVIWMVLTYLCIVAGGAVAVWLISVFGQAVGFLQPVLLPFAVAAVLAFLLDPIVRLLTSRTRLSRTWAVLVVFLLVALLLGLLGVAVVPRIYDSTVKMVQDAPNYTRKAQERLTMLLDAAQQRLSRFQGALPVRSSPAGSEGAAPPSGASPAKDQNSSAQGARPEESPAAPKNPDAGASPPPAGGAPNDVGKKDATPAGNSPGTGAQPGQPANNDPGLDTLLKPNGVREFIQKLVPAVEGRIPAVLNSIVHLLIKSMGAAGVLLDAIIIPVYLYFLLVESRNIARHWNEYLPIRDSPFKKEVVSVLLEINGYLVAFFRGQLLVSTIDGILVGGGLAIMGLDFSFFIGLLVVVLTFIPYLGIILCYIPAILIAIIQYGDVWHPMYVVMIMFGVQCLESTLIAPKIVGDSVGLHPVTVILSVFGWSLLLNGPIGAVLAVPLSATVKVLLRRYVWEASGRGRHFVPLGGASVAALADENRRADDASAGKSDADGPRVAGAPVGPPNFEGKAKPGLGVPPVSKLGSESRAPAPGVGMPSAGLPTPPAEPSGSAAPSASPPVQNPPGQVAGGPSNRPRKRPRG